MIFSPKLQENINFGTQRDVVQIYQNKSKKQKPKRIDTFKIEKASLVSQMDNALQQAEASFVNTIKMRDESSSKNESQPSIKNLKN